MSLKLKYTEQELTTKIQNNDQSCFAYLYDHYSGALYGIIYKMLKDHQLSENVLQETFVKAWHTINSYDSAKGSLFFTWIVNIARHQAIEARESKGYKDQSKILNIDHFGDSLKRDINAVSKFDTHRMKENASGLKNDQKQIIDLAYFEGYTPEEISKKLLIPAGTVKIILRMAIMELRKSVR